MYSNRKDHAAYQAASYFGCCLLLFPSDERILLGGAPDLPHLAVGQNNELHAKRPPDLAHPVDILDTKMPHVLAVLWRGHKSYYFCDSGPSKILHMEVAIYNCENSIPGAGVFKKDIFRWPRWRSSLGCCLASRLSFAYSCSLVVS